MVPVERRVSGGVRCALGGPGKSGSVTNRSSRVGPYPPSAAGLQGVQPLVDSANVGKGSRQNGSVPSEEGLAPRTGSVGPCVSPRSRAAASPFARRRAAGRRNTSSREAADRYGAVALASDSASRCAPFFRRSSRRRRATRHAPMRGRAFGQRGSASTRAFFPSAALRSVACRRLRTSRSGKRARAAGASSRLSDPRARPSRASAYRASRRVRGPSFVAVARFHTGRPGRSGREQNGSTPGTPWSDTASGSPSRRCARGPAPQGVAVVVAHRDARQAFGRRRTVDSELVRTGGIRLSN